ncbi:hypothetical protein VYU27_005684 [Nannochloropsis oceanica]
MHRPFALFSVGHAKAMLMLLLGVLATTQAFLIPSAPFTLSSSTLAPLSSAAAHKVAKAIATPRTQRGKLFADVAEKNEGTVEVAERVITVSDSALEHLKDLRTKQGVDHLYLRMGVRSGGCSGMSYVLDVMKKEDVTEEDHIEAYDEHDFSCVVDPKSLLYLFGLRLDFKDQLIGGGFAFLNPNAQESCGCGSSFGV